MHVLILCAFSHNIIARYNWKLGAIDLVLNVTDKEFENITGAIIINSVRKLLNAQPLMWTP